MSSMAPSGSVILTPDQHVRVFITFTLKKMEAERRAVRDAVLRTPSRACHVRNRDSAASAIGAACQQSRYHLGCRDDLLEVVLHEQCQTVRKRTCGWPHPPKADRSGSASLDRSYRCLSESNGPVENHLRSRTGAGGSNIDLVQDLVRRGRADLTGGPLGEDDVSLHIARSLGDLAPIAPRTAAATQGKPAKWATTATTIAVATVRPTASSKMGTAASENGPTVVPWVAAKSDGGSTTDRTSSALMVSSGKPGISARRRPQNQEQDGLRSPQALCRWRQHDKTGQEWAATRTRFT
jgi:hypothetical protein